MRTQIHLAAALVEMAHEYGREYDKLKAKRTRREDLKQIDLNHLAARKGLLLEAAFQIKSLPMATEPASADLTELADECVRNLQEDIHYPENLRATVTLQTKKQCVSVSGDVKATAEETVL